ncbi:MAG: histidine kinase [Polyangiales bacterium]
MDEEVGPVTIPREVFWICAFAPWLFTPLMVPHVYELPWLDMLRRLGGVYVPFLVTPTVLRVLFDRFAPALLRHGRSPFGRFVRYGALASVGSLLSSLIDYPICLAILGVSTRAGHTVMLESHILHGLIITWLFTLPTVAFEEQRARQLRAERRAREERQAALEAQLSALSARTHPHFFFNSINTVASLIPEDPERAEQTLLRLADILRYALEGGRTRFVSLARELEIVRDYLEVQQARFEAKLRWRIDVAPELAQVAVPPMFLQPLVENAVLHGLGQRSGSGEVRVRGRREHDHACIEVLDDGVGPGASRHHGNGTALSDLAARLRLLYGEDGRLESGARDGGGYRVSVSLPVRELTS